MMSSPRKTTLSSASTKNTALPNVSIWQSSEPKGIKMYAFGDQVNPAWMEHSSPNILRPESSSGTHPLHQSESTLTTTRAMPKILIKNLPSDSNSRIFLKRGFRTERTREDEHSS